jgi:type VI secretion system protein ImpE
MSDDVDVRLARGDLAGAVASAMDAVRTAPQAIGPRMGLFQLACVTGDWKRARTQLDTMAKLDAETMLLARVYGRLVEAEEARARVFAGAERPVALGAPPSWLAMLAQALELSARGQRTAAADLRRRALEEAPANPGDVGDRAFAWAMDADPRLGPTLEVVVEGQYRWLPLPHLRELRADPPKALRDMVWQPVSLELANGSELKAFVPVRYPGTEAAADDGLRLARATTWRPGDGEEQWGQGQRLLATDVEDVAFLELRRLRFAEIPDVAADGA